jgi:hypothetical protein
MPAYTWRVWRRGVVVHPLETQGHPADEDIVVHVSIVVRLFVHIHLDAAVLLLRLPDENQVVRGPHPEILDLVVLGGVLRNTSDCCHVAAAAARQYEMVTKESPSDS